MFKKVQISVIIPCYNSEKWIEDAVNSVINQSGNLSIEIIIIDDCSTDKTAEIIKERFGEKVILLNNDVNCGPSFSRNKGIKKASGKYIALLDSDDRILPDRFEILYREAIKHNSVMITDYIVNILKPKPNIYPREITTTVEKISISDFVKYTLYSSHPLIERRFLIENNLYYNEEIKYAEDFDLMYRILRCGVPLVLVPYLGYLKTVRSTSLSRSTSYGANVVKKLIKKYISELNKESDYLLIDELKKHQKKIARAVIKSYIFTFYLFLKKIF